MSAPPAVRMALTVLLNHVEPGFENCRTVVRAWMDGEFGDVDHAPALAAALREIASVTTKANAGTLGQQIKTCGQIETIARAALRAAGLEGGE